MNKIVSISSIVLLFVAGMGALSYSQEWFPFSSSSESILLEAFQNMSQNNTSHFEADISVKAEQEGEKADILLSIKGDIDQTNIENPKSNIEFDGKLEMEGMSFSMGVESRNIGEKDLYFRITTIPAIPFLGMMGIDTENLKDQWIKVNEEYLEQSLNQNQKMVEEITELLTEKEILIIQEKLSNEKINNINCYHYLISVGKDELVKVVPEFIEIVMENDISSEEMSEEDKQKLTDEAIDSFEILLNKIGDINYEVWIGKKDKQFYQFKMNKNIDIYELYGGLSDVEGDLDFSLKMNFSEFNKEINIQSPEEFKTLNELFPSEMLEFGM